MRERAKGGAAVVSGNIAVSPYAALNGMLRLYDDKFKDGYKKLVDTVHSYDCKFMTQLFHCGRNNTEAVLGMKPIAPSAVPVPADAPWMRCIWKPARIWWPAPLLQRNTE